MRPSLLSLALLLPFATANTEKVIFMGPSPRTVPVDSPTLEDLLLPELSPRRWGLRTHLEASFPNAASEYGSSSWVLLNGLKEGQRYEVRVCWAATEPTSFRLTAHTLPTVFETPSLITSLSTYAESQRPDPIALEEEHEHNPSIHSSPKSSKQTEQDLSVLFLHIQAAADYYTMNRTLMESPPPVFVDIILDPFVFNVLPRSLVPTVGYILLLAVAGWYVARYISWWIQDLREVDVVGSEKKRA